jgi:hypothetical protein
METEDNTDGNRTGTEEAEQEPTNQAGRPSPIILTSTINLLQLQKKVSGLVKGSFEFRSTHHGTIVTTKEMADFSAIKTFKMKIFPTSPSTPNP